MRPRNGPAWTACPRTLVAWHAPAGDAPLSIATAARTATPNMPRRYLADRAACASPHEREWWFSWMAPMLAGADSAPVGVFAGVRRYDTVPLALRLRVWRRAPQLD